MTISVPAAQDKDTKYFQPYMSEAFEIGEYDGKTGKNDNTAGYGRNYTVPLKKVGSLLQMTLVPNNVNMINDIEDVDDVVLKSVEINAPEGTFATTVSVTATKATPFLVTNEKDKADKDKKYAHMKNVTEVYATKSVSSISTTDIDNSVAYFTLLPNVEAPAEPETPATVAEEDTESTYVPETNIVVYTSYGSVTVTSKEYSKAKADTYPLINVNATEHSNLDGAIEAIIEGAWGKNTTSANFKNENTGASFKRQFTFDMKTLDMDGTEVATSKQLVDLLKVYKALNLSTAVTWKLAASNDNFLMTGAALDKLIEVNTKGNIKLALNGNKVTLSDATATIAKLQNANVDFVDAQGKVANADVILGAGLSWTIDQKMTSTNINTLTNKGTLNVTNADSKTTALVVNLINDGAMTVGSSKVTLGAFETKANSTLGIAAGKTLYLGGITNLYGKATVEGIMTADGGVVKNFGEIDNKFEVSVVYENKNGAFYNGGVIKSNGASAVTYITSNKADSYKGIITLTNRNDQVSIDKDGNKGYVKYTLKDTEANYAPAKGDKFNWLTITKTATVKLANETTNVGKETVDYLEIKGAPTNIECTDFSVINLFVEGSMRLLDGNSMTVTGSVFVKDYILRAANALKGIQSKTYTPDTYPTPAKAIEYNGEIRTAASSNE